MKLTLIKQYNIVVDDNELAILISVLNHVDLSNLVISGLSKEDYSILHNMAGVVNRES
jgi:hypothetical protein